MHYDIGFLGGGQLARMSIQAAQRMGLRCLAIDAGDEPPTSHLAPTEKVAMDLAEDMARSLAKCQRITFESEFVSVEVVRKALSLAGLSERQVVPSLDCLATVQDKLAQRRAYSAHGAPSPQTFDVGDEFDFPAVAKTRFGGYDGKGTFTLRSPSDLDELLENPPRESIYIEEFISFTRELAVMVARWPEGCVCFPTVETVQVNHVCDLVKPSGVDASVVAIQAVEAVGGFGLFGVELFELSDGTFQVNEIAPRPHNTGHYTLDWGGISQFEAHVRLVMGWPVPTPTGQPAAMANLLAPRGSLSGSQLHEQVQRATERALRAEPSCHVHWYGKSEAKQGRKMGHINAVGPQAAQVVTHARDAFWDGWN